MDGRRIVGRFAPSPTGAMHLGNIFAAVMSWLSAKSRGGEWLLRIEDLDPQRCKPQFARELEDALGVLGLDYDRGGLRGLGPGGPFRQSERGAMYEAALQTLKDKGLVYGCTCRRADIMATQAPHRSDGRVVYAGTCRPAGMPRTDITMPDAEHSLRVMVENRDIEFSDRLYGQQSINLADECGDFVVRRADGAWAYQLAVVVDDAMMGVTEVVRGADLLNSAAQQIYLYEILGFDAPEFSTCRCCAIARGNGCRSVTVRCRSKRCLRSCRLPTSSVIQAIWRAYSPTRRRQLRMTCCACTTNGRSAAVSATPRLSRFRSTT